MQFSLVFLVVFSIATMFSDDEYSLTGLTQESTQIQQIFSDSEEETSNFDQLLSHAHELAESSQNKTRDFEDFVFDIGLDMQVTQDSGRESENSQFVDVETIDDDIPLKRLRTKGPEKINKVCGIWCISMIYKYVKFRCKY